MSILELVNLIIGLIGTITSVIALIMTLKINRRVKTIQNEFLSTARVPELLAKLESQKNRIQDLLIESKEKTKATSFPDRIEEPFPDRFLFALEECRADLIDLRTKLGERHKDAIESLINSIGKLDRTMLRHYKIGDVLASLTGLITRIKNELEDKKWLKE